MGRERPLADVFCINGYKKSNPFGLLLKLGYKDSNLEMTESETVIGWAKALKILGFWVLILITFDYLYFCDEIRLEYIKTIQFEKIPDLQLQGGCENGKDF